MDVNDLLSALSDDLKKEKAALKDSEIVDWVRKHWHLFTPGRREMESAIRMLGNEYEYSVEGLSMALGLPENVHFTRMKAADVPGTLLAFQKSRLMKTFLECCDRHRSGEIVLIAVAGDSTIMVTNMQTVFVSGMMHLFLKSSGDLRDIHLFRWPEAPLRLPLLFSHEGD